MIQSERFAYSKLPRPCSPPTSPSIEAAAAQQKHDHDDDEKSCHIHVVSPFGQMSSKLTVPTHVLRTLVLRPVGRQRSESVSLAVCGHRRRLLSLHFGWRLTQIKTLQNVLGPPELDF